MGTNDCQCWRCNHQPMSHDCEYGPVVAEAIRAKDSEIKMLKEDHALARAEVERLRGMILDWAGHVASHGAHGTAEEMRKEGEKR